MIDDISKICISKDCSIRDAMTCIDKNPATIALVVDEQMRLIDTITDGDIRRAILDDLNLDHPVAVLRERKVNTPFNTPVTAPIGKEPNEYLAIMKDNSVQQLPLLDKEGRVSDIVIFRELFNYAPLPLRAVVMAGGFGTRLRPLTEELPKPMLPIGDKPLLEHIIERIKESGIHRVDLATHYKGDIIEEYFKDGDRFGVDIRYVREDQPLGSAGALSLIEESEEPILIINGDVLTEIDFRAMHNFHLEHGADMSVGVKKYTFDVPYGVVETDGVNLTGIIEKPTLYQYINAGIYLINPNVCGFIPNDELYDMPDLINKLVEEGKRVISFPIREYWIDIGKHEDYEKALIDIEKKEIK